MSSNIGTAGWKQAHIDPEYFIEAGRSMGLYGINAGDNPYFLPLLTERDFLEAYRTCPPLKAITGNRARCFNNGVREIYNVNTGKPARGRQANNIRRLIKRPNVLQTEEQFFAQQNIYTDIFGYCPFLVVKVPGFTDEYKAVYNIPPWLFDIKYTRKWLYQYKITGVYEKFYMLWDGQQMEIDPKDLHFVLDDGIGTEYDSNLTIPDSRLVGNDYVVSNIRATYKARNTMVTKRGAIGILSNQSTDAEGTSLAVDEEVKKELQKDFKSYGIVGQPYQIIISDANLKWQQMGFNTKDLMLHEEGEDSSDRLCEAFGWPTELMARRKGATYENRREALESVYDNNIIPEDLSRGKQFCQGLIGRDNEDNEFVIYSDFTKVPALQAKLLKQAQTRLAIDNHMMLEYNNGLATKNDWRIALGLDPIDEEEFNKYKEPVDENTPPKN